MILQTGTHDMGNSLITSQMMIVAEELGLELEDIAVVESDTDLTPWNLVDYSSRGVFVTGAACIKIAGSEGSDFRNIIEKGSRCKILPDPFNNDEQRRAYTGRS